MRAQIPASPETNGGSRCDFFLPEEMTNTRGGWTVGFTDPRLRISLLCLAFGAIAHQANQSAVVWWWQMGGLEFSWGSPGWHNALPFWFYIPLCALCLTCSVGVMFFQQRTWVLTLTLSIAMEYLTYPLKVPNHLNVILLALTLCSAVWIRTRRRHPSVVDSRLADGMVGVVIAFYLCTSLHKMNSSFLSSSLDQSAAVGTLEAIRSLFWLTDSTSAPLRIAFAYGSVFIELVAPLIAWRSPKFRPLAILALFLFHLPMITRLGIIEFPWILSSLFPCFFSVPEWLWIEKRAREIPPTALAAAVLGILVSALMTPSYSWKSVFGTAELAVWGYLSTILLEFFIHHSRKLRSQVCVSP